MMGSLKIKALHSTSSSSTPAGCPVPRPTGRCTFSSQPRRRLKLLLLLILLAGTSGCDGETSLGNGGPGEMKLLKTVVVAEYPHDDTSFTQGLLWQSGLLYESTGRYGRSSVRKLKLESKRPLLSKPLEPTLFGEGLALAGQKLYQLTWQEGVALVYDSASLAEVGRFHYSGEGWGLTYDGSSLIMSDGSDTLQFRDPETFEVQRRITVRLNGRSISRLNELEYVDGRVYANIWMAREILQIDPATGGVSAVIDTSALPYRTRVEGEDVLNGIAYRPETGTFLLTGKLWPQVYEVRFE